MRIHPRLLVVLAPALLFSCARGLDPAAEVRYAAQRNDPALAAAASKLRGMTLVQDPAPDYWSLRLSRDRGGQLPHDLFLVDWGQELLGVRQRGALASLADIWPRAAIARRLPAFARSVVPAPVDGFIPSAVHAWGLFYNRQLMLELGGAVGPSLDMDAFVSLLEAAKTKGRVPIALGSSFGWPGAAWHSYLDLRLNGGKAAWERIMGNRPFDDPGGREAAEVLARWRDAGYFSPDAGLAGMEESLAAVESGRALFVLMGSFASQRFRSPAEVGFMQVPVWKGKGDPRGELAGVIGFAVTSWSAKPQAALALVDSYIRAGSTEAGSGSYLLPILFARIDGEDMRAVQSRILADAAWILPSQERIMQPRFVQDSMKEWADFFTPGSRVGGADLAAALQAFEDAAGKAVGP